MAQQMFFDCPGCGHIGKIEHLQEHSLRPCPMDMGFCPKCGAEADDYIDAEAVKRLLADYGDDPDKGLAEIMSEDAPRQRDEQ